jgi:hypothetical protein
MSAKRDGPIDSRRDFLKLAGLAAVTGGGLAAASAPAEASVGAEPGAAGYRETEHVKTYYQLARF